jgi:tRNA pseudouridine38-40 synthase
MARYQTILSYDGTDFAGSQRQDGARTVQKELEQALRSIGWKGTSVLLAGRTDRGVHARGQVAAFDLDWNHALDDLQRALNAHLPDDMAVLAVSNSAGDFHPRFAATARRYRYGLFCQEVRDPLRERYAWRVWPEVGDLTGLAVLWPGTHNFSAFGSPPRPGGSTVRTVFAAGWYPCRDGWTFEIEADAFLYRMVRRLVYVQVLVGQGRLPLEELPRALESGSGAELPAGLAAPSGLMLLEVKYDGLG